jgi:hypothetical protein
MICAHRRRGLPVPRLRDRCVIRGCERAEVYTSAPTGLGGPLL